MQCAQATLLGRLSPYKVLCGLLCQEALTRKSLFCWMNGACCGREVQVLIHVVYPRT